jgi:archaellum biogenesis protein FlaJ (TadC family)
VVEAWRPVRWSKNAAVLAVLAVYVALLPYAGFLIATFLLMSVLFRLNALTVKAALLAACLSSGLAYGLFYLLLKTPLPRGIWGF